MASDAIGVFDKNLINSAGCHAREHCSHARSLCFVQSGCTADRIVCIDFDDLPTLSVCAFTTERDLILD